MSLMLMRTKVDHLNAWWEPHATSTPLKKIPAQLEIKNKAQKQDQPARTKLVDSKRNRKNRLSSYFDPPSSSDDESGEIKRRPIIKLSSKESSTKTSLRNKEPENEKISASAGVNSRSRNHKNLSIKDSMKTRKNMSTVKNPKNQNVQVQNKKNKTETDLSTEVSNTNSDEENKIFTNSMKNKSLLKENKPFLKKKVNSMNCSRNDENVRHPSDFNEIERKKLRKIPKANQILLKPKQVKRNTNKNSEPVRSYRKVNTNNNKLSKFHEMKSKKVIDNIDSFKTQSKKSGNKSMTACTLKPMTNNVNSLLNWENKSNLSHQLFSESTEQEYINTLNLTSDETNKGMESMRYSIERGRNSTCEPFIWPYHSSHKVCTENKDREERPKRIKQAPEKHWIPEDQSPELRITTGKKEAECLDILPKNNSQILNVRMFTNVEETLKKKNTENNCEVENHFFKNQKYQNETGQEPIIVTENITGAKDLKSFKNHMEGNGDLNCSNSRREMNISIPRNEVHVEDNLNCAKAKSTVNSSEKPVFKQLDELPFNGNGSGCSAVQCWSAKNVKCGVFKLKMKSQFACQTLHSNSHLGGVLVKGQLRMKIGIKEQDLKEGDMAFVPPLTEWRATNIGECESVFYYWCGRFGS